MSKSRLGWISILILLLTLIVEGRSHVFAETHGGSKYFHETGHWVSGDFLIKYQSIPDPQEIYGYPITDIITDKDSGLQVQYFEKARFELHPTEDNSILRVSLTPLGSLLYEKGQTLPVSYSTLGCRFFSNIDKGYFICYDFLAYFEKNGGVAQFGYPISNFEIRDGWIVQYFQRARFEWHPEFPTGEWVKVSNLGMKFFQVNDEDRRYLAPNRSADIPFGKINHIKVRAFVSNPITSQSGEQILNIIVQDQYHNPVENAQVVYTIRLPDGKETTREMINTDSNGISTDNFRFESKQIGTVEITVTVHFDTLKDQTKTSFQIWW